MQQGLGNGKLGLNGFRVINIMHILQSTPVAYSATLKNVRRCRESRSA